MHKVFISYRRDSGIYIARTIRQSIENENSAIRMFMDLDEIAGGDFNAEILQSIEESSNFILIITEGSLDRCKNEGDWVRREVAHAIKLGKRIVPVVEEGVDLPTEKDLPEDIRAVVRQNGVVYSPSFHNEAIKKIISFLDLEERETVVQRKARIDRYFRRYMQPISDGSCLMGSEKGRFDERPVREVSLSQFWMMKYPVTQEEYQRLMGSNPGNFKHPKKPVQNVSWFDAIAYCNKWSVRDGLSEVYEFVDDVVVIHYSKNGYRLPTEAEFEYACRAGTQSDYFWGDKLEEADLFAWHDGNRRPNPWNLYDVCGNVFEWCNDWYDPDYYKYGELKDPKGPWRQHGEYKVMRGGAWAYDPLRLRSAARLKRDPVLTDDVSGFRCVIRNRPN
jgi:formylglycine-generating enzyme